MEGGGRERGGGRRGRGEGGTEREGGRREVTPTTVRMYGQSVYTAVGGAPFISVPASTGLDPLSPADQPFVSGGFGP